MDLNVIFHAFLVTFGVSGLILGAAAAVSLVKAPNRFNK
jgi:hypothetical protein